MGRDIQGFMLARRAAWRRGPAAAPLAAASGSGRAIRSGLPAVLAGLLLIASLSGCACRPGYVGPYGGVHPARCWVW